MTRKSAAALIVAALACWLSDLADAQSDREAQSLVEEFEVARGACDAPTLRRFVETRFNGHARLETLRQIDSWTAEQIRKRDEECRAEPRESPVKIARIDRDVDFSTIGGRAVRAVVISYDLFDSPPSLRAYKGGYCFVAVVKVDGEWRFVGHNCSGPGMPPAPLPPHGR